MNPSVRLHRCHFNHHQARAFRCQMAQMRDVEISQGTDIGELGAASEENMYIGATMMRFLSVTSWIWSGRKSSTVAEEVYGDVEIPWSWMCLGSS